MIVVDASVFAFALLLDEGGPWQMQGGTGRRRPVDRSAVLECRGPVGHPRESARRQDLGRARRGRGRGPRPVGSGGPLTRVLLPRMWELRANLTAYDAAYVAAAEAYECALLTTDARMARASGSAVPSTSWTDTAVDRRGAPGGPTTGGAHAPLWPNRVARLGS